MGECSYFYRVTRRLFAATIAVFVLTTVPAAKAETGAVLSHQKISDTQGGFVGDLDNVDEFGRSLASLGDFDGDGVGDLAVGAMWDDDGGVDRGSVRLLFLNIDGTVKSHQKISDTEGGFSGVLDNEDLFGLSVASIGDLDEDGVGDIAVGAVLDDDGGTDRGALWILFLNTDGTVKNHQKISDTEGNFTGELSNEDWFGYSAAPLGDFDGDGVLDLAVGAPRDDDGGSGRGGFWLLFLNRDGTVKAHQKISDTEGTFTGRLDNNDAFGLSIAPMGDFDGDGVCDLAVGAPLDDDGGSGRGAVWVLLLNSDGTVKSHQKISDFEGGFTGVLGNADNFGSSATPLGDFDGDGVADLALGAYGDDDGGSNRGAAWVLFLNSDGTVKSHQKISHTMGGFVGGLGNGDIFGDSVAALGDHNGDGVTDLAVGATGDDDGGTDRGSVWILFLDGGCVRDPAWSCDGDVDGDGQVNPVDSGLVQAAFGSLDGQDLCNYDADCDGQINPVDSGIVQSLFGTCETPRAGCP